MVQWRAQRSKNTARSHTCLSAPRGAVQTHMNQGAGAELQVRVSEAFSGERRRRVWPASGGVAIPPPPPPTEFCPTAAKN